MRWLDNINYCDIFIIMKIKLIALLMGLVFIAGCATEVAVGPPPPVYYGPYYGPYYYYDGPHYYHYYGFHHGPPHHR